MLKPFMCMVKYQMAPRDAGTQEIFEELRD
jgi:hypothetical protein